MEREVARALTREKSPKSTNPRHETHVGDFSSVEALIGCGHGKELFFLGSAMSSA
jgi:hypothetical protein